MRGSEPAFRWSEIGKKHLGKITPVHSSEIRTTIAPILISLAQHETSASSNYATEFFLIPFQGKTGVISCWPFIHGANDPQNLTTCHLRERLLWKRSKISSYREEENQNKDKQNEHQDETEKSAKNKTQEFTPVSRFRTILASSAKNLILLDLGMCVAFPTIAIPSIQNATGPLSFDDDETSWFGE
uniref:(California timema) hypothetical protein n=1 Tax=Timema californicum TaxID=61474 RepID=A0A7R9J6E8_TIMCA|nr:unnamed protein product [Timema californicum]